jgi:hypothetical protein
MNFLRCVVLIAALVVDLIASTIEHDPCAWFYNCAAKADYEWPSVHVPDDSSHMVQRWNGRLALVGGSPEIATPIDDRGNVYEFRNGVVTVWPL